MKHSKLFLLVLACALFFAGALVGASLVPPQNTVIITEQATTPVHLLLDFELADGFNASLVALPNETVGDFLIRASTTAKNPLTISTQDFGSLGRLITDINGYKNGTDNRYWQYWINNIYGTTDAFTTLVAPGDSVLWKYTNSFFNEL